MYSSLKLSLLLFSLLVLSAHARLGKSCFSNLATLDFPEYVDCYSYPLEIHNVTTSDGYHITLFRIQAKDTKIATGKPVVLLWHGLLDSADSWVTNDEDLAPGFMLANQGHDIWFGNSRGNKYCLTHETLDSTKDSAFWAFSWQQMYERDMPAVFSYIADLTGQKINFIGHSQGSTAMHAILADPAGRNSIITNNIRKFAALGPVTYMAHTESKFFKFLDAIPELPTVVTYIFKFGILHPNWATKDGAYLVCTYLPFLCAYGMSLFADLHTDVDNLPRLGISFAHFPAGTSIQNIIHWKQIMDSNGTLQKFDHGSNLNMQIYGQVNPPEFDPSLVTEDVGLFVGNWDELADVQDVNNWYKKLTNAKKEIHYYDIGHLTFLIGKTVPYFDDLLEFLDL